MTISLEEMLAELPVDRRERIEQRAAELIAEELNLRQIRHLRKLTQARLSKKLKIGQEGVSRIEKRSDLYLSTLRSYLEGVGGELTLMVKFPDRPPVILTGLGEDAIDKKANKKARKTLQSKPTQKPAMRRAA
jgi:transcriptional regulator with XRE-family HTH domain